MRNANKTYWQHAFHQFLLVNLIRSEGLSRDSGKLDTLSNK